MNVRVRRAMEIAEQIKDKRITIERLVYEQKELELELQGLFAKGHQKRSISTPPRAKGKTRASPSEQDRKNKLGYWRPKVIEALQNGPLHLSRVHYEIAKKYPDIPPMDPKKGFASAISSEMSRLMSAGVVFKVKKGIYALSRDKKAISKSAPRQATGPKSKTWNARALKNAGRSKPVKYGYWEKAILPHMEIGHKTSVAQIMQRLKLDLKDQALRKRVASALGYMAKNGLVKHVERGVYVKVGSKPVPTPKALPPKPKRAIKNFQVKNLTDAQASFLGLQKPDSLTFKILKIMKHGKEYNLDEISGKIDPNKGKLSYRTALGVLMRLEFIESPNQGKYVRV